MKSIWQAKGFPDKSHQGYPSRQLILQPQSSLQMTTAMRVNSNLIKDLKPGLPSQVTLEFLNYRNHEQE